MKCHSETTNKNQARIRQFEIIKLQLCKQGSIDNSNADIRINNKDEVRVGERINIEKDAVGIDVGYGLDLVSELYFSFIIFCKNKA